MNTPGSIRGRPTKKQRPRPPQTRRQRFIELTGMLAHHPTQTDLFSPARRAHAKFHVLRERGAFREAVRDLRRAMREVQKDIHQC